jgi:hypothetical protein
VYGELETGPFDGPMGRVEPGDRLRLYVAPPDDDSPLRGDMTGRGATQARTGRVPASASSGSAYESAGTVQAQQSGPEGVGAGHDPLAEPDA